MIGEIPSQSLKMLIKIQWNANQRKIEKEKKNERYKDAKSIVICNGSVLCYLRNKC